MSHQEHPTSAPTLYVAYAGFDHPFLVTLDCACYGDMFHVTRSAVEHLQRGGRVEVLHAVPGPEDDAFLADLQAALRGERPLGDLRTVTVDGVYTSVDAYLERYGEDED